MRIGIFSEIAEHPNTGPGNIIYNLITHMEKLEHNHEMVLIHTTDTGNSLYENRENIELSPNPIKSALRLRNIDFDILHFNSVSRKESYVFPFFLDTINVATQYGDVHFADPSLWPQGKIKRYRKRWAQIFLSRYFEKIMPLSRSAKDNMVGGGIPEGKLSVVPPGLDDIFHGTDIKNRDEREDFLLHVCNFQPSRKNPGTLLKSFEYLIEEGHELRLKIAGSGWTEDVMRSYITKERSLEKIDTLGRISQEEVLHLYKNCAVYLAPTRHEGFGLTALESMVCGTPVISNGVYAVPEVVGDAALLIDNPNDVEGFAEAIIRLLEDESLWEELSRKGRERSEHFSWEESAKKVLQIYEDLHD